MTYQGGREQSYHRTERGKEKEMNQRMNNPSRYVLLLVSVAQVT